MQAYYQGWAAPPAHTQQPPWQQYWPQPAQPPTKQHKSKKDRAQLKGGFPLPFAVSDSDSDSEEELTEENAKDSQQAERFAKYREELNREKHLFKKTRGKGAIISNPHVNKLMAKPFHFLERNGCETLKERAEIRSEMTYEEYVVAYLLMMAHQDTQDPETFRYMYSHLVDLARDRCVRSWPAIRAWSQRTFDRIEANTLKWQHVEAIRSERTLPSLSEPWAGAAQVPPVKDKKKGTGGSSSTIDNNVPCVKYNKSECDFSQSHTEAGTSWDHVCSYCNMMFGASYPHPYSACEKRNNRKQGKKNRGNNRSNTVSKNE